MFEDNSYLFLDGTEDSNDTTSEDTTSSDDASEDISSDWDTEIENDIMEKSENDDENIIRK